jgi:hypothetical protein
MARVLLRAIGVAVVYFLIGITNAQESIPEARMAETVARVCVAGMRSGEALTLEQFGDQFALHQTRSGETELEQARGQPWVRLSLNGV